MKYLVIYDKAKDGTIWARVPDLIGYNSCGSTIQEAKPNVKEAISLYIETAIEEGIPIPAPHHIEAEMIKV